MRIFRSTAIFLAAIMIGTGAGFGCRGELETPKETNSKSNVLTKESATVDKASVDENVSATSAIDLKNCRALLIGVDEYEKLPSLEYASYDVKKFAARCWKSVSRRSASVCSLATEKSANDRVANEFWKRSIKC